MSTKLPIGRTHTGSFTGDSAQRQAQVSAIKTNAHVDAIAVLNNRAYATLAIDVTLASVVTYATLVTASLTSLLSNGFLIVTFTSSCTHTAGGATTYFRVVVDGAVQPGGFYVTAANAGDAFSAAIVVRVPVVRGPHRVDLQWRTDNNSSRIRPKTNISEHANMLVQEAA